MHAQTINSITEMSSKGHRVRLMNNDKERPADGRERRKIKAAKIRRDILRYGGDIIGSDAFARAGMETHHVRGDVASHSMAVCTIAARICDFLEKNRIRINKKDVIQAALCHDLGMIGRDKKYRDDQEAWRRHPADSVTEARAIVPDLSREAEEMISSHMWPLSGKRPRSREAIVLNIADKCASFADIFKRRKASGGNSSKNEEG